MPRPDSAIVTELLETALAQGRPAWLTVSSNSMRPLLCRGDQIALAACRVEEVQPGDIVVVRRDEDLLAHRCRARWTARDGEQYLLTRGDRAVVADPEWPASALLGRVVARRRTGRTLDLTHGAGRRLHRHLAWLARVDEVLFLGTLLPTSSLRPQRGIGFIQSLGRATLHHWGALVDAVVTAHLPRSRAGQKRLQEGISSAPSHTE